MTSLAYSIRRFKKLQEGSVFVFFQIKDKEQGSGADLIYFIDGLRIP